jgi:hypothetical protein
LVFSVIKTLLAESSRGVGTAWPAAAHRGAPYHVKQSFPRRSRQSDEPTGIVNPMLTI